LFGVGLRYRKITGDTGVDEATPTLAKHTGIDIGKYHMAAVSYLAGEDPRQITRAASEIQDDVTVTYACLFDRKVLPQPVKAAGHQVIHDVISAGDRIENALDPVCLVGQRYGFVSEMRRILGAMGFNHYSDYRRLRAEHNPRI
jgi:hypothetical protein